MLFTLTSISRVITSSDYWPLDSMVMDFENYHTDVLLYPSYCPWTLKYYDNTLVWLVMKGS